MKGFKKLLTGILAATLIMGSSMTAFADETPAANGTITIEAQKNADGTAKDVDVSKQVYHAWRVFDYVPVNKENMAAGGIYKLSDKFKNFSDSSFTIVNDVVSGTITEADEKGNPTQAAQEAAKKLGEAAVAYAKANSIAPDGSNEKADGTLDITITGLAYGYYVVDSSLGVAVSINTTLPNAQIYEKNDIPSTHKQVNEGSAWGDTSDANIGDTVNYRSYVTIPKGGVHKVTFTDEMTLSLTPPTEDAIMVDGVAAKSHKAVEDVVVTNTDTEHKFVIKFKDEVTSALADGKTYEITYSATLNKDAVIKGSESSGAFNGGNDNRSKITYGNNVDTDWDFTRTYTYPVKIVKINNKKDPLEGAEFTLAKTSAPNTLISFVATNDGYRVATTGDENTTTTLEVGKAGIIISGLDRDVYRLTETKAPEGYKLLTPTSDTNIHYVDFTVDASPVCTTDTKALQALEVGQVPTVTYTSEYLISKENTTGSFGLEDGLAIVNTTGATLPSTGGIGTTIFYIVGGLLIVAGVAFFIVRRKGDAE
ncbi:isopeptide-forming domain-containing fimbrial protein [Butyrivibrio sp. MB2005]|uniref:isopeptide-forming domain-containing fimbrial protein n=1 Tax=Butyrivibrio sp. MB2005 TaxID=1280678 RepID=UPI0003FB2537|nr:isopeptide-forming domain-containing fimbrial protein [Butyrivibrio sp. MB2005]